MLMLIDYSSKVQWTGYEQYEGVKEFLTVERKRDWLLRTLDIFVENIPESMEHYTLGEFKTYYKEGRTRAIE